MAGVRRAEGSLDTIAESLATPPQGTRAFASPQPTHASATFCPRDGTRFGPSAVCGTCGLNRDSVSMRVSSAPAQRWRKLLYVRQAFPDNFVDESTFLDELQRNVNVRTYDYNTLVYLSVTITQHLATLVIFVGLFINAFHGHVDSPILVATGVTTGIILYASWDAPALPTFRPALIKASVLFLGALLGMSPLLRTLTQDTSSDTVWAVSTILFTVSLLTHDYSLVSSDAPHLTGIMSLNAAVFASVVLASRLPSTLGVFGLMLIAILWFAFIPLLRRRLLVALPQNAVMWMTVGIVTFATCVLIPLSTAVTVLFLTAVLFVTFICPAWLIWIQQYKNEIRGPWDEARLSFKTSRED